MKSGAGRGSGKYDEGEKDGGLMGELVEVIRRIGLFLVAAQVILHLAPEKRYERYLRLIAGVIVLGLLARPLFRISEEGWQELQGEAKQELREGMERLEQEYGGEDWESISDSEKLLQTEYEEIIKNEVKSKLNNFLLEEELSLVSAELAEEQGLLLTLRTAREPETAERDHPQQDKEGIQIHPVSIRLSSDSGREEEGEQTEWETRESELKQEICRILEMNPSELEVRVQQ